MAVALLLFSCTYVQENWILMATSARKYLWAGWMPIQHPSIPLHYTTHPPNAIPAHVRIPLSYSEDGKVGGEVGLVPRPLILGFQEVYDLYVYVR